MTQTEDRRAAARSLPGSTRAKGLARPLEETARLVRRYFEAARAENTVSAYDSDLRDFATWCRVYALQGKLVANLMASLAEFEHDLLRERVRSGVAAAKARGQTFGRRPGYRPSDKKAPKVMELSEAGCSQRRIARELELSKTTVNELLKRSARPCDSSSSGS